MSTSRIDLYVTLARDLWTRSLDLHEAVARRLGLHATDLRALRMIGQAAVTVGAIAEGLGLTGPSASALVDRLEGAGYVLRHRDETDRRRVTIRANAARLAEIDAIYASYMDAMAALLEGYSEAEFAAITDYLTRTSHLLTVHAAQLRGDR